MRFGVREVLGMVEIVTHGGVQFKDEERSIGENGEVEAKEIKPYDIANFLELFDVFVASRADRGIEKSHFCMLCP